MWILTPDPNPLRIITAPLHMISNPGRIGVTNHEDGLDFVARVESVDSGLVRLVGSEVQRGERGPPHCPAQASVSEEEGNIGFVRKCGKFDI